MYNFFATENSKTSDGYEITGKDYNHIKNVLRKKAGEDILVTLNGKSDLCCITDFTDNSVIVKIIKPDYQSTELPTHITLFQGIAKGEKMELIIQKAVELGASEIVPVDMKRCIAKIEPNKARQKTERFNLISESAAKQSKRNVIPKVLQPLAFNKALDYAKDFDLLVIPYECASGMQATKNLLSEIKSGMKIGVMIGAEGGFDDSEIESARQLENARVISLGSRILRTETASLTTLSLLMLYIESNL
ncbi:MAG: 16S rRNA (uracil(1498)-N(3))-methyltransferase [Clostridia bacterium]|nr:16S rRNA (uracil(1498)-N(3))-methyltransferase [Clostridia bacterium]